MSTATKKRKPGPESDPATNGVATSEAPPSADVLFAGSKWFLGFGCGVVTTNQFDFQVEVQFSGPAVNDAVAGLLPVAIDAELETPLRQAKENVQSGMPEGEKARRLSQEYRDLLSRARADDQRILQCKDEYMDAIAAGQVDAITKLREEISARTAAAAGHRSLAEELRPAALKALRDEWDRQKMESRKALVDVKQKLQKERDTIGRAIARAITPLAIRMTVIDTIIAQATEPELSVRMVSGIDQELAETLENG